MARGKKIEQRSEQVTSEQQVLEQSEKSKRGEQSRRGEKGEKSEKSAPKRRSRIFWQIFSGTILLNSSLKSNYRYIGAMALMCFVSIAVMFMVLYADMRYTRADKQLQLVRERSIRLQEELYQRTTYHAVHQDLEQRGIHMRNPQQQK